jgi:hypothetical protein
MRAFLRRARHAHLSHGKLLAAVAILTLVMDAVGSVLVYLFEQDPEGPIATFGDSVFWTTAQLLTISSQLEVPVTTGGKIVDIVLELWAITAVTTLAGSWGAFLLHRRHGPTSHSG